MKVRTGNISVRTGNESGFTLIEIIVVLMIVGILATMSVTLVSRARANARETAAVVTLNSLAGAYEAYWSRHAVYPHWGPGQRFSDPKRLFMTLVNEGYLPHSYSTVPYIANDRLFYLITDDYALEIYPFSSKGGTRSPADYYWLVFHPIGGFQREQGVLGIGTSPSSGKVAIRPRISLKGGDIDQFTIYGMHRAKQPNQ